MNPGTTATITLLMSAALLVLTGCPKKEAPAVQTADEYKMKIPLAKGSAERVGRDINGAAEQVDEKIKQLGERSSARSKGRPGLTRI
ncbi:MAG TPA: hypothetical protein VIN38_15890 [Thiobacillus sp.]